MTPRYSYIDALPDLISETEYAANPSGRLVRLRIRASEDGVEILGDAMRPATLEQLLEQLSPDEIEQMLCG